MDARQRLTVTILAAATFATACGSSDGEEERGLFVGAAAVSITPGVGQDDPAVWIAGYRQARRATGVHDDLFARALVVDNGSARIALVAVDVVGFLLEQTEKVRQAVRTRGATLGVDHVVVAATHNHESPDTMGLWGPSAETTGIHLPYQRFVEDRIVEAITRACDSMRPATLGFAETRAKDLIVDSRLPTVIDDRVLVMHAVDAATGRSLATLVNFASHAEIMGRHNTLLTADYPGYVVRAIERARGGVALFFPGAVGGLLTPRGVRVSNPATGLPAPEDSFQNAELYGEAVAGLALEALGRSKPSSSNEVWHLTRSVSIPLDNERFRAGAGAGIIGGGELGSRFELGQPDWTITTEVGVVRIGDGLFLIVPGEIYPELVQGGVPQKAEPGVDYPDAPAEPPLLPRMAGPLNFVLGLANDEIGYLIPRRQWDQAAPFAYGREKPQYGEGNSVGPMGGTLISRSLHDLLDLSQNGSNYP